MTGWMPQRRTSAGYRCLVAAPHTQLDPLSGDMRLSSSHRGPYWTPVKACPVHSAVVGLRTICQNITQALARPSALLMRGTLYPLQSGIQA